MTSVTIAILSLCLGASLAYLAYILLFNRTPTGDPEETYDD